VEDDPVELAESVYLSMFISGIEPNVFDGLLMLIDMNPDGSDMGMVSPRKT
jgi:hypothetical protein